MQTDAKIAIIANALRDRMRFYKLSVAKDASQNEISFNSTTNPEETPEDSDPARIHWVTAPPANDVVIGERVNA